MTETKETYEEFVEKFKPKLTTDDCYTPQNIYDVILGWVRKEYEIEEATRIMRPFYPGGDYRAEDYSGNAVVIDNPPFSMIAAIVRWYDAHNVRFFLFAPTLTLLNATKATVCAIVCGARVIYKNGAAVNTSFVTNLDDEHAMVVCPELKNAIEAETKRVHDETHSKLPEYVYPDGIISAANAQKLADRGETLEIRKKDALFIRAMDAQRAAKKGVFGGGLMLSEHAAKEYAAAKRSAAKRYAEKRIAQEREAAEKRNTVCWELSEREKQIAAGLQERSGVDH